MNNADNNDRRSGTASTPPRTPRTPPSRPAPTRAARQLPPGAPREIPPPPPSLQDDAPPPPPLERRASHDLPRGPRVLVSPPDEAVQSLDPIAAYPAVLGTPADGDAFVAAVEYAIQRINQEPDADRRLSEKKLLRIELDTVVKVGSLKDFDVDHLDKLQAAFRDVAFDRGVDAVADIYLRKNQSYKYSRRRRERSPINSSESSSTPPRTPAPKSKFKPKPPSHARAAVRVSPEMVAARNAAHDATVSCKNIGTVALSPGSPSSSDRESYHLFPERIALAMAPVTPPSTPRIGLPAPHERDALLDDRAGASQSDASDCRDETEHPADAQSSPPRQGDAGAGSQQRHEQAPPRAVQQQRSTISVAHGAPGPFLAGFQGTFVLLSDRKRAVAQQAMHDTEAQVRALLGKLATWNKVESQADARLTLIEEVRTLLRELPRTMAPLTKQGLDPESGFSAFVELVLAEWPPEMLAAFEHTLEGPLRLFNSPGLEPDPQLEMIRGTTCRLLEDHARTLGRPGMSPALRKAVSSAVAVADGGTPGEVQGLYGLALDEAGRALDDVRDVDARRAAVADALARLLKHGIQLNDFFEKLSPTELIAIASMPVPPGPDAPDRTRLVDGALAQVRRRRHAAGAKFASAAGQIAHALEAARRVGRFFAPVDLVHAVVTAAGALETYDLYRAVKDDFLVASDAMVPQEQATLKPMLSEAFAPPYAALDAPDDALLGELELALDTLSLQTALQTHVRAQWQRRHESAIQETRAAVIQVVENFSGIATPGGLTPALKAFRQAKVVSDRTLERDQRVNGGDAGRSRGWLPFLVSSRITAVDPETRGQVAAALRSFTVLELTAALHMLRGHRALAVHPALVKELEALDRVLGGMRHAAPPPPPDGSSRPSPSRTLQGLSEEVRDALEQVFGIRVGSNGHVSVIFGNAPDSVVARVDQELGARLSDAAIARLRRSGEAVDGFLISGSMLQSLDTCTYTLDDALLIDKDAWQYAHPRQREERRLAALRTGLHRLNAWSGNNSTLLWAVSALAEPLRTVFAGVTLTLPDGTPGVLADGVDSTRLHVRSDGRGGALVTCSTGVCGATRFEGRGPQGPLPAALVRGKGEAKLEFTVAISADGAVRRVGPVQLHQQAQPDLWSARYRKPYPEPAEITELFDSRGHPQLLKEFGAFAPEQLDKPTRHFILALNDFDAKPSFEKAENISLAVRITPSDVRERLARALALPHRTPHEQLEAMKVVRAEVDAARRAVCERVSPAALPDFLTWIEHTANSSQQAGRSTQAEAARTAATPEHLQQRWEITRRLVARRLRKMAKPFETPENLAKHVDMLPASMPVGTGWHDSRYEDEFERHVKEFVFAPGDSPRRKAAQLSSLENNLAKVLNPRLRKDRHVDVIRRVLHEASRSTSLHAALTGDDSQLLALAERMAAGTVEQGAVGAAVTQLPSDRLRAIASLGYRNISAMATDVAHARGEALAAGFITSVQRFSRARLRPGSLVHVDDFVRAVTACAEAFGACHDHFRAMDIALPTQVVTESARLEAQVRELIDALTVERFGKQADSLRAALRRLQFLSLLVPLNGKLLPRSPTKLPSAGTPRDRTDDSSGPPFELPPPPPEEADDDPPLPPPPQEDSRAFAPPLHDDSPASPPPPDEDSPPSPPPLQDKRPLPPPFDSHRAERALRRRESFAPPLPMEELTFHISSSEDEPLELDAIAPPPPPPSPPPDDEPLPQVRARAEAVRDPLLLPPGELATALQSRSPTGPESPESSQPAARAGFRSWLTATVRKPFNTKQKRTAQEKERLAEEVRAALDDFAAIGRNENEHQRIGREKNFRLALMRLVAPLSDQGPNPQLLEALQANLPGMTLSALYAMYDTLEQSALGSPRGGNADESIRGISEAIGAEMQRRQSRQPDRALAKMVLVAGQRRPTAAGATFEALLSEAGKHVPDGTAALELVLDTFACLFITRAFTREAPPFSDNAALKALFDTVPSELLREIEERRPTGRVPELLHHRVVQQAKVCLQERETRASQALRSVSEGERAQGDPDIFAQDIVTAVGHYRTYLGRTPPRARPEDEVSSAAYQLKANLLALHASNPDFFKELPDATLPQLAAAVSQLDVRPLAIALNMQIRARRAAMQQGYAVHILEALQAVANHDFASVRDQLREASLALQGFSARWQALGGEQPPDLRDMLMRGAMAHEDLMALSRPADILATPYLQELAQALRRPGTFPMNAELAAELRIFFEDLDRLRDAVLRRSQELRRPGHASSSSSDGSPRAMQARDAIRKVFGVELGTRGHVITVDGAVASEVQEAFRQRLQTAVDQQLGEGLRNFGSQIYNYSVASQLWEDRDLAEIPFGIQNAAGVVTPVDESPVLALAQILELTANWQAPGGSPNQLLALSLRANSRSILSAAAVLRMPGSPVRLADGRSGRVIGQTKMSIQLRKEGDKVRLTSMLELTDLEHLIPSDRSAPVALDPNSFVRLHWENLFSREGEVIEQPPLHASHRLQPAENYDAQAATDKLAADTRRLAFVPQILVRLAAERNSQERLTLTSNLIDALDQNSALFDVEALAFRRELEAMLARGELPLHLLKLRERDKLQRALARMEIPMPGWRAAAIGSALMALRQVDPRHAEQHYAAFDHALGALLFAQPSQLSFGASDHERQELVRALLTVYSKEDQAALKSVMSSPQFLFLTGLLMEDASDKQTLNKRKDLSSSLLADIGHLRAALKLPSETPELQKLRDKLDKNIQYELNTILEKQVTAVLRLENS